MAFRFSPKPNAASEIAWRPWGEAAFEEAERLGRPVLLSISAVWCHWCHVMDERTYSDPQVHRAIGEAYIPVRVDADGRPDIDQRYNMGGWPSTVFLTPQGAVLTGGTYLPPEKMLEALGAVADIYRQKRDELPAEEPAAPPAEGRADPGDVASVEAEIFGAFDEPVGGFGRAPKFPHTDVLSFLLARQRLDGDAFRREVLQKTLRAMAEGGLYDPVEGGFFRYATRRDWSEPHYEKMLSDNAALLEIYTEAAALFEEALFEQVARGVGGYLAGTLFSGSAFFGSQDADEHYYTLDLERRRAMAPPFRDPVVYTGWNADAAGALLRAGTRLGAPAWVAAAKKAFFALCGPSLGPGGLCHTGEDGGAVNLLSDLVAVGQAGLDFWGVTGEAAYLDAARRALALAGGLKSPAGGFFDRPPGGLGRLSVALRPLSANARAARFMLAFYDLQGREEDLEMARSALSAAAAEREGHGFMAAPYAQALLALGAEGLVATVDPGRQDLVRAVLALGYPRTVLKPEAGGKAMLCLGTRCARPVEGASDLAGALEGLLAAR